MSEDIPAEIRDFLSRHIRSVAQLDVLYLLSSNPDRMWTAEQVAAELRNNVSMADTHLRSLANDGLIHNGGDWYKCCGDAEIAEKINRMIYIYNLRRPAVIHFIYSQPNESIRAFADAFKIKKDGD